MVQESMAGSARVPAREVHRAEPGLRAAVRRLRSLAESGGLTVASALVRPRLVRGAYLESRVDARAIETERLVLRPHTIADAEAWHRIGTDPRVLRHLSWPRRDAAASRQHLKHRTRHTVLWQADDFFALAVTLDGQLIGDVSLQLRTVAPDVRAVEVGWLLDPQHEGQGYATEAVRAILTVAFAQVHARVALAVINEENTRSVALARRLGFSEVQRGGGTRLFVVVADQVK